jgi:glucan phosphoethanolaminetransferase (alkaline phosphatase superfamily)
MQHNEHNYYWGMHMGWWFFILVIVILIAGWITWSRKRK